MDPLMLFWVFLIGILSGLFAGIFLVYRVAVSPLRTKLEKILQQKQSLSTIYGKLTEQFAPFMKSYPFSPENFRFIGSPIDGIQFENDRIIFVEIKTNRSKLSTIQQRIKKLVKDKKIEWFEFYVR
ncbi:MAG: endonuclease [Thermoplasmata archaeon]|nr:endonuclease [Thermoplasmata archaeon]